MKYIFKILLLVIALNGQILFAQSDSEKADTLYNQAQKLYAQKKYKEAIPLYEESYSLKPSKDIPANTGISYKNTGKYEKAREWYILGVNKFDDAKSAFDLALLYEENFKNIKEAIKWYEKAYVMGNISGAHNLGYLYDVVEHDYKNAIIWYKKAAKEGDGQSINNLGEVYHDLNKNIVASAYILAGIAYGYNKVETFKYLKETWNIDAKTLKEAYRFQKKLDIPKYYYDKEFEDKVVKKKTGRR